MHRIGDIIETEQNHGAVWGETVVMRFGPPREADDEGGCRVWGVRGVPIPVSLLTLKSSGSVIDKFVLNGCIFLLCCYWAVP